MNVKTKVGHLLFQHIEIFCIPKATLALPVSLFHYDFMLRWDLPMLTVHVYNYT